MSKETRGTCGEVRSSALWGSGNRGGEHRTKHLWQRGGRTLLVGAVALVTLVVPAGTLANSGTPKPYVPSGLYAKAATNPDKQLDVIVTMRRKSSEAAQQAVGNAGGSVRKSFTSIPGVAATMNGRRVLALLSNPNVASVTADSRTRLVDYQNNEMWRSTTKVDLLWGSLTTLAPKAPAIAIVDSGVEPRTLDFGTRLVASVVICSLCPAGASGDEQGHGTLVAGLAAGAAATAKGAAPNAPIVSIRTSTKHGESKVSDVIAAVDWILANKATYDIRVANFSLARAEVTDPLQDPLNRAVQKLWLGGVTVVAAAGNYGSASGAVKMRAPGNDPLVITAGAVDQMGTSSPLDDTVPAWSAYGVGVTGFAKPEVSAAGRYLISAVPANGTLPGLLPGRVTAPGYMWMSGTSFSSAIVSGVAAQILARHPDWTPDQVKGALMLTAQHLASQGYKAGVGEVDAAKAATLVSAPNANEAFAPFVVTDATGARVIDWAAWNAHVAANPTWSPATFTASSWSESSWSESSWSESSWSESSWSESSWSESSWSESSWSESSWSESSWSESSWSESSWSESSWSESSWAE